MWALLLLLLPALFLVWFALAKAKRHRSDARDLIVAKYLQTPKGKALLAEAMTRPIRQRLDRKKIERKVIPPMVEYE